MCRLGKALQCQLQCADLGKPYSVSCRVQTRESLTVSAARYRFEKTLTVSAARYRFGKAVQCQLQGTDLEMSDRVNCSVQTWEGLTALTEKCRLEDVGKLQFVASSKVHTLAERTMSGAKCRLGEADTHSEHHFPASSPKLCQNWLRRPLKGNSLSSRICPPTPSAPSDRFGY